MAKSDIRTFSIKVVRHDTIGPVRAETCYLCKHARHKRGAYWKADYCAYFSRDLKPPYHRCQACLDAEMDAEREAEKHDHPSS